MRMNHVLKGSVLAGAAVVAVAALSAPSQAQSPKKGPTPTPAPAETGCFNILAGGSGGLSRHVDLRQEAVTVTLQVPHDADLKTFEPHKHPYEYTYDTFTPQATDDVEVSAALRTDAGDAEDCSAVRYRLRLVGENGRLITDVVVPGATGPELEFRTFFDLDRLATDALGSRFALASVTAENASGQEADTTDDENGALQLTLEDAGGKVYGG